MCNEGLGHTPTHLAKKDTGKEQEDASRCDVPDQRPHKENAKRIQRKVHEATTKVQQRAPLGERAVCASDVDHQDKGSEERKGLEEIGERSREPCGHASKRWELLVAGTGRPAIAALETGGVRGEDDVNKAEDDAQAQQLELETQCCCSECPCGLTFEFTRVWRLAQPAIARRCGTKG